MYKHFSQKEIDQHQLADGLWAILDMARETAQTPFIITSGRRTPEHNKAVGGVPSSSHVKGLAADISCANNIQRSKILWGLMQFRNELFIEICSAHIHIDIDSSIHPLGSVMWSKDK